MKEKIFKKDKGNIGVTEMIMLLLTIIICFTIICMGISFLEFTIKRSDMNTYLRQHILQVEKIGNPQDSATNMNLVNNLKEITKTEDVSCTASAADAQGNFSITVTGTIKLSGVGEMMDAPFVITQYGTIASTE